VVLQSETLHVQGQKTEIALVEYWTGGQHPGQLIRYQVSDHLDSVRVEVDDNAALVSYEEYTPYGDTTYQLVLSARPKRYRWTSKERDCENGLYYNDMRYYAPWLGRWIAPDPAGLGGVMNLYAYAECNPIAYGDPTGLMPRTTKTTSKRGREEEEKKEQPKLRRSSRNTREAPTPVDDDPEEAPQLVEEGPTFDPNHTGPSPDQDPDELKRNQENVADEMAERLSNRDLHHVYPQTFEGVFAWLGINIDQFTIPLAKEWHQLFEYGSAKRNLPAWQQYWEDRFFNGNFSSKTKERRIEEAKQIAQNPTGKKRLQNLANEVVNELMTIYGLPIEIDNPLRATGQESAKIRVWIHYKLVNQKDRLLKDLIRNALTPKNLGVLGNFDEILQVKQQDKGFVAKLMRIWNKVTFRTPPRPMTFGSS
jgi:RHS repeat-associated protein